MSIPVTGFVDQNGAIRKYDYNYLENTPITNGEGAYSIISVDPDRPNTASGDNSIALGGGNQSIAPGALTIGTNNIASAQNAIAIGSKLAGADPNTASAPAATALGLSCTASGYGSVAVGYNTTSSGTGSTSMGYQTSATIDGALASGYLSTASGSASAAIGFQTTASGTGAAAVGRDATASGAASTALGRGTTASASQALAAGRDTKAEAVAATALGYGTDATGARSLVAGAYNAPDTNEVDTTHGSGARKYLMIIGNGTADTARSNAATLDWDGNLEVAGDVVTKDGSFSGLKSAIDNSATGLNGKAPVIINSISGDLIHITDGADSMPVKALTIDGAESAIVTRTGKNLFSYGNIKRKNVYRATVSPMGEDLNSFYLSGAQGAYDRPQLECTSWAYVDVFIGFRVEEETAITVSCKVKNYTENCNGFVRVRYNTTETRDGSTDVKIVHFDTVGTSNISISGIIPSGNYVFFEFSPASKGETFTLTQYAEIIDFQFELGAITTAYEAYHGNTFAYPSETVTTLYGVNNIWSNAGTVDVDYCADTKLYIQNINQPTEDDMTADAQIASGKYFLIGNTLYKSTAIIPAGDTIVPGTNCIKTNLAEALNALNT